MVAAVLVRVALLAAAWNRPEGLFTPDSKHYAKLSASLATDWAFRHEGRPEIFRTPGYPFFLTFSIPFGLSWWRAVAAVQVALDVLVVCMTFLLGCVLCSRRVGLWAAALQAVNPLSAAAGVRMLSDGPFTVLLVFAVLLAAHYFRTSHAWAALGAAAALGLSCYIRPVGALPLGIVLVVMAWRDVRGRLLRSRRCAPPDEPRQEERKITGKVPAALLAAVVSLGALCPWIVRNFLAADYVGFSSAAEVNAFRYEAPAVLARVEGVSMDAARTRLAGELRETAGRPVEEVPPGELARMQWASAGRVIRAHPGTWAAVHARTSLASLLPGITDVLEVLGVTLGQRGTLAVLQQRGLAAAVRHYFAGAPWAIWVCIPPAALLACKYLFAVLGAVRCLRAGAAGWMIVLLILALVFVGGPAATPRFRVPAAPLISLLAAVGWVALLERLHHSSCFVAKRRFAE